MCRVNKLRRLVMGDDNRISWMEGCIVLAGEWKYFKHIEPVRLIRNEAITKIVTDRAITKMIKEG